LTFFSVTDKDLFLIFAAEAADLKKIDIFDFTIGLNRGLINIL